MAHPWSATLDNAIISSRRPGYTAYFRDLDVFRGQNGDYFMVVGAQRTSGKGALALARSRCLVQVFQLRYDPLLAHTPVRLSFLEADADYRDTAPPLANFMAAMSWPLWA